MSLAKANPDYRKPIHVPGFSWWPWARQARTRIPAPPPETELPRPQPALRLVEARNLSHRPYTDF